MDGYVAGEQIALHKQVRVFRALRAEDNLRVVVKALHPELVQPKTIDRMRHEFAILQALNEAGVAGVPLAVELRSTADQQALVTREIAGPTLRARLAQGPLSLEAFFQTAIPLCALVEELHARGVVHKDIKPDNVLCASDTEVHLVDFGIASQIAHESQDVLELSEIAGTLLYISPEQTGRMNRALDHRTDLYTLGATLYHMLVGRPPFPSDDAVELIHSHIAKPPPPLRSLDPAIPQVVADIIAKLLSKNAEDRYQSAAGLKHDLERCAESLRAHGTIEAFPLAAHDASSRFQLSPKLYGRAEAVSQLLDAFERAVRSEPQLTLVSGVSGVGKSAVIQEIRKPVIARRATYVPAKADQFERGVPYGLFIEAIAHLAQQLLAESEAQLRKWKTELTAALASNGAVLTALVPALELVIGKQPPVVEMGPKENTARLQRAIESFLRAFARPERPLVLFFDDLQWADMPSLRMLERLLGGDVAALLVVCAYRENEVDAAHPFMLFVDHVAGGRARLTRVEMRALTQDDATELIADTLHHPMDAVRELSAVLLRKTGGNPFFLRQLLQDLHRQKLITFDRATSTWVWDLARIGRHAIADNVADLLAQRLGGLSSTTLTLLQVASCLGGSFEAAMLARVLDAPEIDVLAGLHHALLEELVLREEGAYHFVHDRVQHAVVATMTEAQRAQRHADIAAALLAHATATDTLDTRLAALLSHVKQGIAVLRADGRISRLRIVELAVRGAQQAKAATAGDAALERATLACEQLVDSDWQGADGLAFEASALVAEGLLAMGQGAAARAHLEQLFERARTRTEKVRVLLTKMRLFVFEVNHRAVVDTALDALALFGEVVPRDPAEKEALLKRTRGETARFFAERPVKTLLDLPEAKDAEALERMRIYEGAIPSCFFADKAIWQVFALRFPRLVAEVGLSPIAAYALSSAGAVQCLSESGFALVQAGIQIADRYGDPTYQGRAHMVMAHVVSHWHRPMRAALENTRLAIQYGQQTDDYHYICWAMATAINILVASGAHVDSVIEHCDKFRDYLVARAPQQAWFERIARAFAVRLRDGRPDDQNLFGDPAILETLKRHPDRVLLDVFLTRRVVLELLAERLDDAVATVEENEQLAPPMNLLVTTLDTHAISAIVHARKLLDGGDTPERRADIARRLELMRTRAERCPANFSHAIHLVEALVAQADGRIDDAERLFNAAIDAAVEHRVSHYAAMANEAAGRFCVATRRGRFARVYFNDAHMHYVKWGANEKARSLEESFRDFLPHASAMTETYETASLDLESVMRGAQLISSELDASVLQTRLMEVVLENAGAQRGLLFLEEGGALVVRGVVGSEGREPGLEGRSLEALPADAACLSLVRLAARTGDTVVIDDATLDPRSVDEPRVHRGLVRSLACVPLAHRGTRLGSIYLENGIAAGAFTPARMRTVALLAGQGAISLQHATLHAERERALARAEESGRLKTGILQAMSHELRTPLNAIVNLPEIVAEQFHASSAVRCASCGELFVADVDEVLEGQPCPSCNVLGTLEKTSTLAFMGDATAAREQLAHVSRSGRALLHVVSGVLDAAALEAGSVALTVVDADLGALVASAVDARRGEAAAAQVALELHVEGRPRARVDAERLTDVCDILLSNAIKFSSAGKAVRVSVLAREADDVIIEVRDVGIGIPAHAREVIFESFRQVDMGTTRRFGGTGLGLFIARKLVELHRGTIEIESVEGVGSTFRVVLPAS